MLKNFMSELGGPRAIAAYLADATGKTVTVNAVYQWPYREEVPERWRFFIAKLAKKKKIKEVPPEIRSFMQ